MIEKPAVANRAGGHPDINDDALNVCGRGSVFRVTAIKSTLGDRPEELEIVTVD